MGCNSSRGAGDEQPEIVQPTRNTNALHTRKVVLVGDTAVGKSSVVLRYTKNQFHEAHQLTIGAVSSFALLYRTCSAFVYVAALLCNRLVSGRWGVIS